MGTQTHKYKNKFNENCGTSKGHKDEFNLFKFVINNNEGITIQINMFDQEIKKFSHLITKNEVKNLYSNINMKI